MDDFITKNKNRIVGFFESGSKGNTGCDRIGMEVEHFIVDRATGCSACYYGPRGVESILRSLRPQFRDEIMSDGHLIGLRRRDCTVTLEPGAQIELSIIPGKRIAEIKKTYETFIEELTSVTDPLGYDTVCAGYRPGDKAEDIPLIPKNRYRNMDRHFSMTGTCGRNMMRGTGALQISIDYRDEEDFRDKFRTACFISPLLALTADNAPVFEGRPYEGHTLRQYIWQNVDDARTGIPPVIDAPDFGFEKYAEYISSVPLIVTSDNDDIYTDRTLDQIYAGSLIEEKQIAHAASMVFPDVRLVTYIEIRVGDSMPLPYSMAYAALIKGLFLNTEWLAEQKKAYKAMTSADIAAAKRTISEKGYDADVYGEKAGIILDRICDAAVKCLPAEERAMPGDMTEMIKKRETLADRERRRTAE